MITIPEKNKDTYAEEQQITQKKTYA